MDVFGHVALSLLVGRAVAPRPELRRVTTLGALAGGLLPDVDAVTYLWGPEVFLEVHQRYTHNLIALVVLPALMAALPRSVLEVDRRWLYFAALAGMVGHLVGDMVGLWPVPLLYPFSNEGLAFFLLDQDFSPALELVLVLGATSTFLDRIAASVRATRLVFAVTMIAAGFAIALT